MRVFSADDLDATGVEASSTPTLGMRAHQSQAEQRYRAVAICRQDTGLNPHLRVIMLPVNGPRCLIGPPILISLPIPVFILKTAVQHHVGRCQMIRVFTLLPCGAEHGVGRRKMGVTFALRLWIAPRLVILFADRAACSAQ